MAGSGAQPLLDPAAEPEGPARGRVFRVSVLLAKAVPLTPSPNPLPLGQVPLPATPAQGTPDQLYMFGPKMYS